MYIYSIRRRLSTFFSLAYPLITASRIHLSPPPPTGNSLIFTLTANGRMKKVKRRKIWGNIHSF